jgi:hypothetical protein
MASLLVKRGRETKGTMPESKSNQSLPKKKKLMAGGQDELSILASMGILDRGPVRTGKSNSSGSADDKWWTTTDIDVPKDQPSTASKTNKKIKKIERIDRHVLPVLIVPRWYPLIMCKN